MSGIVSAVLTQLLISLREGRTLGRERNVACAKLAANLETYAIHCSDYMFDIGNHYSSDGHAGAQHGSLPPFAVPEGIEWKAISPTLVSEHFAFQNLINHANGCIQDEWDNAFPGDDVYQGEKQCARIGIAALDLAGQFRAEAKLPAFKNPSEHFDIREAFATQAAKSAAIDARNREQGAAMLQQLEQSNPVA